VQEENQTLATITLQNYFRMYDKLAGMTGTALTEATEFLKIYELPVVQIPTNAPMIRSDLNDQVYKTKQGKWSAVTREIAERVERGQPVLVGTISVEVSELLSDRLTHKGIKHTVLNAKPEHAQREGEIVAEAGSPGAVTIATNMAGRGVDIKLGGNPEHLTQLELVKLGLTPDMPDYEEHYTRVYPTVEQRVDEARGHVVEAGGLFILGTERHESRRIDNQLRGRSGRQGDPGESRFFLSAEDDLVRLFAGDRIYKILDRLGGVDEEGNEEPIEAGMLSKQIEKAQRKVEEQHYLQRKHTLEYDDVLNQQREVIYTYRDEVLEGRDIGDAAREELASLIERLVAEYTAGDFVEDWDVDGLIARVQEIFTPSEELIDLDPHRVDREELTQDLQEEALAQYDRREQELGEELMREIERLLLLQIIDQRWREHLYDMDYLREGIHLRGFAQIEPLVAYKNEAFTLFSDLMNTVWGDFARMIFHVQVVLQGPDGMPAMPPPSPRTPSPAASSATGGGRVTYSGGAGLAAGSQAIAAAAAAEAGGMLAAPAPVDGDELAAGQAAQALQEPLAAVQQRRVEGEPGRNDPCWCGSGKKYKKCHGA
jgi:preprotein translocase subunit SecA